MKNLESITRNPEVMGGKPKIRGMSEYQDLTGFKNL
jgi:hypothetical protein